MAEPIHYGAPGTLPANEVSDWLANGSSRFGVIGNDSWKVTALTSLVRGIQFAPGKGWSDGILTEYDTTNVPAPIELPVTSTTKYFMVVSRVNWQEPLTRTFVAVEGNETRALPINSVNYYREPGVIADFPVALVQVPANSLDIGEIIDLRVWRGDAGWLKANDVLALQYLDRDMTVVEINGALHRRMNGTWSIVGRTDEADLSVFRSLVMNGNQSLPSGTYTTIWNMRNHVTDRPAGISFSGGVGTIQIPGIYEMEGQVTFPAGPAQERAASLTVDPNGAKYTHRTFGPSGTLSRQYTVKVSHKAYYSAGTQIALQAFQGSGSGAILPGDADVTRWTIQRVGR